MVLYYFELRAYLITYFSSTKRNVHNIDKNPIKDRCDLEKPIDYTSLVAYLHSSEKIDCLDTYDNKGINALKRSTKDKKHLFNLHSSQLQDRMRKCNERASSEIRNDHKRHRGFVHACNDRHLNNYDNKSFTRKDDSKHVESDKKEQCVGIFKTLRLNKTFEQSEKINQSNDLLSLKNDRNRNCGMFFNNFEGNKLFLIR